MEICVVGAGHVGLVTGACLSELGHRVICVDRDRGKLISLRRGKAWFYEPRLEDLVRRNVLRRSLTFSHRVEEGVRRCQVIFIAVGTPPLESGDADLSALEDVVRRIVKNARGYRLIVEKSTVPVETGRKIREVLEHAKKQGAEFEVASNPEFLREGSAVEDFFHPDRIVIGVESARARRLLEQLYRPLKAPLVVTDIESAELIKHASNAFLATKISFINAIGTLCERVGADIEKVALGMGLDTRIGRSFLKAGIGYGGFCFPKDLDAFIRIADKLGYDFQLLKATREINEGQKWRVVEKISRLLWNVKGKKVALLGLAFKPDTDDLRFAPSLAIIEQLRQAGAEVTAYDPQAMKGARVLLKGTVRFAKNPYDAVKGADCLVLVTEWEEFRKLDFRKVRKLMRQPILVDGRNLYSPEEMKKLGFRYTGMGRGGVS